MITLGAARHSILSLAWAAVLTAGISAQVFDVPGDYATLSGALAAVPANAVIVVHGGSHAPITVTQPVTIVGSPLATIVNTFVSDPHLPSALADAITLDGPGSGRVTFENVRTTGTTSGIIYSAAGSGVEGSGFAEVHFIDCDIQPAQWVTLTGAAKGAHAIDVSATHVLIERCTVTGGFSETDSCFVTAAPNGGAAIFAPGATVTVLDSTITGGGGPHMCFTRGLCLPPPLDGSDGGPGIVAATVFRAASTIAGGKGQPVTCDGQVIGTEEDGPDIVADAVTGLGSALSASGPTVLGASWTLGWSTSPPTAFLAYGVPTQAPVAVGSKGHLFLDADTLGLVVVPGGPAQTLMTTLPAVAAFAGIELGVQVYDPIAQQLTRPVVGVLRP